MPSRTDGVTNSRELDLVVLVILGVLVYGILGFLYTIFAEAYVRHQFGNPQKPYGPTAMFSIVVCAFLGGLSAAVIHDYKRTTRPQLVDGRLCAEQDFGGEGDVGLTHQRFAHQHGLNIVLL